MTLTGSPLFTPAQFMAHLERIQSGSRFQPNRFDRIPTASDPFWQTPLDLAAPVAHRLSVPPGLWPPVALRAFILMGSGRTSNDAWLEVQRLEDMFRVAPVPDVPSPLGPSCHALVAFLRPVADKTVPTMEDTWIQVARWLKSLRTAPSPEAPRGTSWTLRRDRLETRLADHLEAWWALFQEHRLRHGQSPFHPPCAFPVSADALPYFANLWVATTPVQPQAVLTCMADLMTWLRPQDDDPPRPRLAQVGQTIRRLIDGGACWPKTQPLDHPVFEVTPGLSARAQAVLFDQALPAPATPPPRVRM